MSLNSLLSAHVEYLRPARMHKACCFLSLQEPGGLPRLLFVVRRDPTAQILYVRHDVYLADLDQSSVLQVETCALLCRRPA